MDWNENDYHCRQSGVRTQGPDTAVRPVSLTAGRSKPLNESLNESDGISPESGQVDGLNESTVLRHRFLDALGESTNSPVATFAQGGREQPVRRDCGRTAVAPDLLLRCPRSHPPRRVARRAGSAAVKCTTIAQCTGQIRPAGFSLAIHQDGDYPYSRSNARGLPFVGGTYANISTPGLTRHKVRQPHTYP